MTDDRQEHRTDGVMVASHIPLLTRCFDKSEGPVLELGTGYFSTLLLHWLATVAQRHVYSYESRGGWFERAQRWQSAYHHIRKCESWAAVDLAEYHWGLAFVDHSPNRRRPVEIGRLRNLADLIVIHDTEPAWDAEYGYSQIWPLFKWRYDYTGLYPSSSVVSNFRELDDVR